MRLTLGQIARFVSTRARTGQTGRELAAELRAAQVREERFALQGVALRLVPHERVARCLRYPYPLASEVQVLHGRGPQGETARFGGLEVCGSVWLCPVCAAKITERWRRELEENVARWVERWTPGGRGGVTVRAGHAPQELAAFRNATIGVIRRLGTTTITATCRQFMAQPLAAFRALGAQPDLE